MASTIVLKRRVTSIRNTRQITKAMELVSASKLRRAQEYAQRSRDYRDLAYDLLKKLNAMSEVERQPLFRKSPVKNRLYIIITSNTGLAGAYNANILKLLTQALQKDHADKVKSHVITVGNKGAQYVRRLHDVDLLAAYPPFGDHPTANDIRPMLNTVIEQYRNSKLVDDIQHYLQPVFKSTMVAAIPQNQQLLPAPGTRF